MKLTKNLSREEFTCKCGCGFDTADYALVTALQDLRDHFERPVEISSGCRCTAHNASVGGSKGSQHMKAKASDIKVRGVPPHIVYDYLDHTYAGKYGVILHQTFVHFDVRDAEWREKKIDL